MVGFDSLPLEIQIMILESVDHFPSMLCLSNQNTQLRASRNNERFVRSYFTRHTQNTLGYFYSLRDIQEEYAEYLEIWFVLVVETQMAIPVEFYHLVARYNLFILAAQLRLSDHFNTDYAVQALHTTVIKYDSVDVMKHWTYGLLMEMDMLVFNSIRCHSEKCFLYLVPTRFHLDFEDDEFVSLVGNLDSSALSFIDGCINYTQFSNENFLVILKMYAMHLQTELFLNAINAKRFQLDSKFSIYLLKQIIQSTYCEELERLARVLFAHVNVNDLKDIWISRELAMCEEVFLIFLDALKQDLTLRSWLMCIFTMVDRHISDHFLDRVVNLCTHFTLQEARIFLQSVHGLGNAQVRRLLRYPLFKRIFDSYEYEFYEK